MADSNEPGTETVRIEPLPQSVPKPLAPDTKSRDTVRIQLGSRQPPESVPFPAPTEPSSVPKSAAHVPTPADIFPLPPAVPNKKTARIQHMPDLPSKLPPTVQMKKTQPLIAVPHTAPATRTSIVVAPAERNAMPLCWVLLGVSAIILIIQIWTYFS
jgi:hypothetical protein